MAMPTDKTLIEGFWAPLMYRPDLGREERRTIGILVSVGDEWRFLIDEDAVRWLRRDYGLPEDMFGRGWAESVNDSIGDLGAGNLLARPDGYDWGYHLSLPQGRSTLIVDEPGALDREAQWLLGRVAHPPDGALAVASGLTASHLVARRWGALCRCVAEFEPDFPAACAERRDDLDTAIVGLRRALEYPEDPPVLLEDEATMEEYGAAHLARLNAEHKGD